MIVLDASTLILLAKVELLDLFLTQVSVPVVIPNEVARESCGAKRTLDALVIRRTLDTGRIKTMPVKSRGLVSRLRSDFSLGRGEAEAIALALNEKAQLLAIDDKCGINACKFLGLAFTTALGFLIRSREKQLLDAHEALEKLSLLASCGRYRSSIIEDAKRRLEAKP